MTDTLRDETLKFLSDFLHGAIDASVDTSEWIG
jgi:hypothetical protein